MPQKLPHPHRSEFQLLKSKSPSIFSLWFCCVFAFYQLLTSTPVSQRRPQDSSSAEGNAASIPGDSEAAPRSASTSPLTPRAEGHSTSRASTDISGCRVASPCLISAICRLISNLLSMAPKETISSVQEHQLHSILIRWDPFSSQSQNTILKLPTWDTPLLLSAWST